MSEIGAWICAPCGKRLGRTSGAPHISTWHIGHCDYCGAKDVPVTQPRDFGYPKLPEAAHGE
jgi:DNA-directed RNA polymerase subunit RPC12/RpoP